MSELVRAVRGIVGATLLRAAILFEDAAEFVMDEPEPREPELGDDDAPPLPQEPLTPEAAAMLAPPPRPQPPAPKAKPPTGSIAARTARMRSF